MAHEEIVTKLEIKEVRVGSEEVDCFCREEIENAKEMSMPTENRTC